VVQEYLLVQGGNEWFQVKIKADPNVVVEWNQEPRTRPASSSPAY